MNEELDKLNKLRQETEEEYMTFINSTFKHATIKSELKSLAEEFLADFYKTEEKRNKLSFNQAMTLYIALHKQDNDFASSVLNAIAKKNESGDSTISKLLGMISTGDEKKEPSKEIPISKEKTDSIKKVISIIEEVKELGKSEN
jgi:hypothetical protein